jgi:hypothetical protein
LRGVEEEEAGHNSKRGPASTAQAHWNPLIKAVEPGMANLRWKFKCCYCSKYMSAGVSIPRILFLPHPDCTLLLYISHDFAMPHFATLHDWIFKLQLLTQFLMDFSKF